MAMRFLTPNATCSLTGASAADCSGYVWFGLVAPDDSAASAAFYAGSSTSDPHLWSMAASPCTSVQAGPFAVASQEIYVQLAGTNACALVATASG